MSNLIATGAERPLDPDQSMSSAIRWTIMLLLGVGVLISNIDRSTMSSAIAAESFRAYFALSSIDKGWLNSAFFWSYGIFQIPAGYIVDRYGVKWPYAICFALWCLAAAATGMMETLVGLVVMRFLIGVAESMAIPASFRWLRNNFSEQQSGTATGFITAGNKFGPAIGAPIAIWLIDNYSWRDMFIATGLVGLLWLIPWLMMVRNDFPSEGARVTQRRITASVPFSSILSSPVVWGSMIVNFCYSYFTFFCMQWMPDYLHNHRGLSLEVSGIYTFFSFIGIAVVSVASGWVADRLIASGRDAVLTRKAFTIAGFLGACSVLLGVRAESLDMALFWNIFSLTSLGLATANHIALGRITLIPKPAVGRVTGVQQFATSFAGGLAGALTGWLLHISNNNYELPMLTVLIFLIIGAAATWILMRPKWSPKVLDI
ncbi:Sugar phosphate permease [Sphingobium sp. AP50]|uniref:MFS transporter n=1 Tax=Sphingobium sp. AP50 TaxID=1884369 RepID=UPI0008ABF9C1|nr:MFS transporter [Sphingobium sp. AP50]SEJ74150.1 Sugar phosphate permease [Sphingobium sp. AP50]